MEKVKCLSDVELLAKHYPRLLSRLNRQQREIDRLKSFNRRLVKIHRPRKPRDLVTVLTFDADGKIRPYEFIASERNPINFGRTIMEMEADGKLAAIVKHGKGGIAIRLTAKISETFRLPLGELTLSAYIAAIRRAIEASR